MKKTATIFLNGEFPGKSILSEYLKRSEIIIAADGGGNLLIEKKIIPHFIIGDLDSLSEKSREYYKNRKVKVIRIKEQETTDFEKCLNFCLKSEIKEIYVMGGMCLRPDHTLNNISILKRYHKKLNIKFISDEFEIFFIDKKIDFAYKLNETVSFIAVPSASGVVTSGLKYKLSGDRLEFGVREGTLNSSVKKNISISFKSGSLLLFKKHFIK